MSPDELALLCGSVPLFPLPEVVFLPHTLLPLHVFEPRYRTLVSHALEGDRLVVVPRLAAGWRDSYAGAPPLVPVAGIGYIVRHQPMPDGRSNIVLLGLARVHIEAELAGSDPFRTARVRVLPDHPSAGGAASVARGLSQLRQLVGQLAALRPERAATLMRLLEEPRSPEELVDTLAHVGLRDPDVRQAYLEEDTLMGRVERVGEALAALLVPDGIDTAEA